MGALAFIGARLSDAVNLMSSIVDVVNQKDAKSRLYDIERLVKAVKPLLEMYEKAVEMIIFIGIPVEKTKIQDVRNRLQKFRGDYYGRQRN